MRALTWRGEVAKGEDYTIEEIPADMADRVAEYREKLLEAVAETDDELMELYLGGEELTVEHPQRALHLYGEVDVPRGVDDVDLVVLPVTGRRGGRDGDAALLLLLHPVHGRRAVVHLTDLVVDAGVEQDALGRGGLARVDVGHDPDVADLGQVGLDVDSHVYLSELSAWVSR